MLILPHFHLINNTSGFGSHYRTTLAVSDWTHENTEWMDNAEMPNGCVLRSSIDLVLLARNFMDFDKAIDFMKKLMDFCMFLKDNNIVTMVDVMEHVETRFNSSL